MRSREKEAVMKRLAIVLAVVILAVGIMGSTALAVSYTSNRGWVMISWTHTGANYYAHAHGFAGEDPMVQVNWTFGASTKYMWANNGNTHIFPIARSTYWSNLRSSQAKGQKSVITFEWRTNSAGRRYPYVLKVIGGMIGD
jgi:hypothetical protein